MRRLIGSSTPARVTARPGAAKPVPSIKELFEASGRKGFAVVDDKKTWTWKKPKAPEPEQEAE